MVPCDGRLDVGQQLLVAQHHLLVLLKPEVDFDHLRNTGVNVIYTISANFL
jgi:hypothetical protein